MHYNCIIIDSSGRKNKYVNELDYMYSGFNEKKANIEINIIIFSVLLCENSD